MYNSQSATSQRPVRAIDLNLSARRSADRDRGGRALAERFAVLLLVVRAVLA